MSFVQPFLHEQKRAGRRRQRHCLPAALLAALFLLAGCGAVPTEPPAEVRSAVVTVEPLRDWTEALLGSRADGWEITVLCSGSTDLHSYQPSADDVIAIANADLFLYVGGESDVWAAEALADSRNPDRIAMSLLEQLGDRALEEEPLEGMQPEHEAFFSQEEAPDEHIWLSLRNAMALTGPISQALTALDPAGAEDYRLARGDYCARLDNLDRAFRTALAECENRTLLLADRYPFRYLAEDYGLTCYAAFSGCSAETGASFRTVAFLAETLLEQGLPAVCQLESGDGTLARTVMDAAGMTVPVVTLDSMQSGMEGDYLTVMERNLALLRQALGGGAYPAPVPPSHLA